MYKKTKVLLVASALGLVIGFMPNAVLAVAYNDLTLTSGDAVIDVGGYAPLNITGSNAVVSTITVNPTNFSFTLLPGSSLQVTSPDRKTMTSDAISQNIATYTCNGTQSIMGFTSATDTVTITVTPSVSTFCVAPGGGGSGQQGGSGGGGGGGGSVSYSAPAVVSSPTPTPVSNLVPTPAVVPSVPASVMNTSVSVPVTSTQYTRSLSLGAEGDDVASLQTFLENKGLLTMPKGVAKGYFGASTKNALMKYQKSKKITANGNFGPATTASVKSESSAQAVVAVPSSPTPSNTPVSPTSSSYSRNLSVGSSGDDVAALQTLLESQGFLTMPSGTAKGYFGAATKNALMKYQKSVGISAIGTFGPATRAYVSSH